MTGEVDLWERLERSRAAADQHAAAISPDPTLTAEEKAKRKKQLKRSVRILDFLSVLFWVYALAKIFFIDVDRHLVRAIDPSYEYLVDYRFFFYVLVIAIIVFVRRTWLIALLYIFLFPLLLVVWKTPAFFLRRKSWPLFLGTLQALFTAAADLRYNLVSKALALFACLFILTVENTGLIAASFGYLFSLLAYTYWRTIKKTFQSPSFLTMQRDKIGSLVNSELVKQFTKVDDDALRSDIELWSKRQVTEITTAITYGIAINRGLWYWSYQLEQYRRNVIPSLIFSAISYVWLFIGTVLSFAFMNFALFKMDENNFSTGSDEVSFIRMLMYAFSRLFLNDGGSISAASDRAYGLQIIEGFAGVIFLTVVATNFVVTARRERSETELRELVAELRNRAKEHEEQFEASYFVTVNEARERLENLGADVARLLSFLTLSVPADFFRDAERASTASPADDK